MSTRNLLDIRRAAYTAADWQRREEISERVLSEQVLSRWERNRKDVLA